MSQKLLSIIVPSYNMEKYLPKCLGSLIVDDAELLQKLDVIVVNDGSKDRTSEIAHEFEAKYPGVFRVIDKPNGNYGSCINAALPVASGKYVKVLDADDTFVPEALKQLLLTLDVLPDDVDLIITDYSDVDAQDRLIAEHVIRFEPGRSYAVNDLAASNQYIPMHTYTYRVEMLRGMGYRQCEGISYTDTEWIWLPLAAVRKMRYVHAMVYRRLMGREGQTMDPAVRAKSVWMLMRLAEHVIAEIDRLRPAWADGVSWKIVEKKTLPYLDHIYREAIFGAGRRLNVDKLHEFDLRLKELSKEYYEALVCSRYSRRLPIRYIRLWRSGSWVSGILLGMCRMYSKVVSGGSAT